VHGTLHYIGGRDLLTENAFQIKEKKTYGYNKPYAVI